MLFLSTEKLVFWISVFVKKYINRGSKNSVKKNLTKTKVSKRHLNLFGLWQFLSKVYQ